jgi:hypothetical protein
MRILAAPCCLLRVNILFPSGSGEALLLPERQSGGLKFWRRKHQKTFGKGFLKLISAEGHVLTNLMDLQAGVQDGEHLTAVAQQAKVAASDCAFALCCGGNQSPWAIQTWVVTVLQCKISSGICNKFRAQVVHLHLG